MFVSLGILLKFEGNQVKFREFEYIDVLVSIIALHIVWKQVRVIYSFVAIQNLRLSASKDMKKNILI